MQPPVSLLSDTRVAPAAFAVMSGRGWTGYTSALCQSRSLRMSCLLFSRPPKKIGSKARQIFDERLVAGVRRDISDLLAAGF